MFGDRRASDSWRFTAVICLFEFSGASDPRVLFAPVGVATAGWGDRWWAGGGGEMRAAAKIIAIPSAVFMHFIKVITDR